MPNPEHRALPAPSDLAPKGRGRRLWAWATRAFEIEHDELVLVAEACRTLDRIDALEQLIGEHGLIVAGSMGQGRLHPAVGEQRQQRMALGRLLAQINLPEAVATDEVGSDKILSLASVRGMRASRARWARTGRG